jgi:hypothetical protein
MRLCVFFLPYLTTCLHHRRLAVAMDGWMNEKESEEEGARRRSVNVFRVCVFAVAAWWLRSGLQSGLQSGPQSGPQSHGRDDCCASDGQAPPWYGPRVSSPALCRPVRERSPTHHHRQQPLRGDEQHHEWINCCWGDCCRWGWWGIPARPQHGGGGDGQSV